MRRRVEFVETDMMQIVHYSNFFRYAEAAETAFFRSIGLSITKGEVGWPRVHAEFDYKAPLRFEDEVEVALLVQERRTRSFAYAVSIRKVETDRMVEVARGKLVVACVRKDPESGTMKAVEIPADLAALIEPAPPGAFNEWLALTRR
jgi:YbgC/YbaW family acyl-CoA thioester hydrolase